MRFINHNCGFNNRLNLFVWNHIGFPPCLFSKHFDATSYLKALFLCWKGDWFGFIIRGRCLPWAFLSPSNHQETSSPSTLKPESRLFIFIIEIRLCSRCNVVRWLRQHPIINQGPLVSSPTLLAFLSIFKNALYLWLPLNTRWEIFSGGNINGVCVCVLPGLDESSGSFYCCLTKTFSLSVGLVKAGGAVKILQPRCEERKRTFFFCLSFSLNFREDREQYLALVENVMLEGITLPGMCNAFVSGSFSWFLWWFYSVRLWGKKKGNQACFVDRAHLAPRPPHRLRRSLPVLSHLTQVHVKSVLMTISVLCSHLRLAIWF